MLSIIINCEVKQEVISFCVDVLVKGASVCCEDAHLISRHLHIVALLLICQVAITPLN